MSSLAQDYIDLIASGDKQKISCVLLAAGGAASISGLAAGAYFAPANVVPGAGTAINATAAGIGAVLGALLSAKTAYKACGAGSTKGSFDGIFSAGKISATTLHDYEASVKQEFGVSASEARLLAKAAYIYSNQNASAPMPNTTSVERKNAVAFLLKKLSDEGVQS
jgi:hypothetical protein